MDKSHLKTYAGRLRGIDNEDQLKRPVSELIESVGKEYKYKGVKVPTETPDSVHGVRFDIEVKVNELPCGHIELKKHGKGADPNKFTDPHDKEQWEKLKGLENLIYTDGEQWGLYRSGECLKIVKLSGDPIDVGKAAITDEDVKELGRLLRAFLAWGAVVPHQPKALAEYLAPLTDLLRSEVEDSIANTKNSALSKLANEWRKYLLPDIDDAQFADYYAQTVTYALLLAKISDAKSLASDDAVAALKDNNGLLAKALEVMSDSKAKEELKLGFDVLKRSLEALDVSGFKESPEELRLYFYEYFLAAYDPKLRKRGGVYYTPREVVELQVRLSGQLLVENFGKRLGFADEGVVFLDPAVGTGTYLVSAVGHGLEKAKEELGEGGVAGQVRQIAKNMHGFEILIGPYAVAHWRLRQTLESYIADGEKLGQKLKIYLADTLASPHEKPPGGFSYFVDEWTKEHEDARKLKKQPDILVCLGNPPYNADKKGNKGGWVHHGDRLKKGQQNQKNRPIFEDFTEPAKEAGYAGEIGHLHDDYVFFWRWALWRLFEQQKKGGIITFITPSTYLWGDVFVGMREMMRSNFDELWIIDLEGDNRGSRKTANIFGIQSPVAIAIGMRGKNSSSDETPAKVHYIKIEGDTPEDKLKQLAEIETFESVKWQECPDDWQDSFMPENEEAFFDWPAVADILPWVRIGSQFKRTWPIGETKEVVEARYKILIDAEPDERKELFKESKDGEIYIHPKKTGKPSIAEMTKQTPKPLIERYSYRVFDRRYAITDERFAYSLGSPLVKTLGKKQVFFTTQNKYALGKGAAMVACAYLPDLDHFSGSKGGKGTIPLYRDPLGNEPNITHGLLDFLGEVYDMIVTPEDLAAYTYAVLGGQSYTKRFWKQLEKRSIRLPFTKNGEIFARAVKLGKKLIWLHTYAERFQSDKQGQYVPKGKAKIIKGISSDEAKYPEKFSHRAEEIIVDDSNGRFGPVAKEVWEFEVSGFKVVQSWLGFRKNKRKGKKTSPLDKIRPQNWTPKMSQELLELLWVVEATLDLEPKLKDILDEIVASDLFLADELPKPTKAQRKSPGTRDPDDPQEDWVDNQANSPESEENS